MRPPHLYPFLVLAGFLAAILIGGSYAHLAGLWIWLEAIDPITWILALGVALGLGLMIGGGGIWVGVALLRQDVQSIPAQVSDRIADLGEENNALNLQLDQLEEILALLLEPEIIVSNGVCQCCGGNHPGLKLNPLALAYHQPLLVLDANGNDAWIDCPVALAAQYIGTLQVEEPTDSNSQPALKNH